MPQHCKNSGSTFIIAIFLSVIILSLGLGGAQMVIKELNFSSDLLFGEQAYYAAESGVEVALMSLESSPVQHVANVTVPLGTAAFMPSITNITLPGKTFSFSLTPLQTTRFRLLVDDDDSLIYDPQASQSFDMDVLPGGKDWQWKTLCQDSSGRTHALQNVDDNALNDNFLFNSRAKGFVPGGSEEEFDPWVANMVPETCFFSVQNLSDINLDFTFTPLVNSLAPPVARIESVGLAGNRQKKISFNYAQQNLGGLFDFVLFHWEGN